MKKRPRLLTTATCRLAGLTVVSVLALMTVTGTVFASGGTPQQSGDSTCLTDGPSPSADCHTAPAPNQNDGLRLPPAPVELPTLSPGDLAGPDPTPQGAPGSSVPLTIQGASGASDIIPQIPASGCPAQTSRGGTLGHFKMTLLLMQTAFPNCGITGSYFDTPVSSGQTSPQVAGCQAAFNQLATAGLIPLNATITLFDSFGDTCVFVNGLLTSILPQQSFPPITPAMTTCLTAWQQALLGGTVNNFGFWVITDLAGDTCLFNGGVFQALRAPSDTLLAPQIAIGSCMVTWQQALIAGTAGLTGYFVLPDGSGDTCVFFNSVLQSLQLPGTATLFWTNFI